MTDTTAHEARQRVRVWYAKGESIKFISHHDEFRLWERTLRRERIYFANRPADAALMAQYPVVQQEALAAPPGVRGVSLRGREPGLSAQAGERTLSERAGDEFD